MLRSMHRAVEAGTDGKTFWMLKNDVEYGWAGVWKPRCSNFSGPPDGPEWEFENGEKINFLSFLKNELKQFQYYLFLFYYEYHSN